MQKEEHHTNHHQHTQKVQIHLTKQKVVVPKERLQINEVVSLAQKEEVLVEVFLVDKI